MSKSAGPSPEVVPDPLSQAREIVDSTASKLGIEGVESQNELGKVLAGVGGRAVNQTFEEAPLQPKSEDAMAKTPECETSWTPCTLTECRNSC